MKIETKYDVGQTVWMLIDNCEIIDGQIDAIIYRGGSVVYHIEDSDYSEMPESEIFPSNKDARKSMLTRRIKKIKRMLEADELCLAELEKEEKTENDAEKPY